MAASHVGLPSPHSSPWGQICLLLVENVGQVSTFLAEGRPVPGGQTHFKTDPLY